APRAWVSPGSAMGGPSKQLECGVDNGRLASGLEPKEDRTRCAIPSCTVKLSQVEGLLAPPLQPRRGQPALPLERRPRFLSRRPHGKPAARPGGTATVQRRRHDRARAGHLTVPERPQARARQIIDADRFFEIYLSTSLEVCESRDVKGSRSTSSPASRRRTSGPSGRR